MIFYQLFNKNFPCLENRGMKASLVDIIDGEQRTHADNAIVIHLQYPLRNDNAPFTTAPNPVNQYLCDALVGNLVCFPPVPVIQLQDFYRIFFGKQLDIFSVNVTITIFILPHHSPGSKGNTHIGSSSLVLGIIDKPAFIPKDLRGKQFDLCHVTS